ncbi:MAG: aminodeoxychorismate synthase component I [Oxalicibacterium faecigallinarum]|uniref:aminodeoxychorismate synthase component I n=1 Tax=Oxalicibacterium faecigallinarum TaxID=573741 RepID=UPI002807B768|nr:aminodeoxychorismate synthase component I [Oxalicibacterium faecigallinarum]MDQ7969365.1 aminodeoxychorismate synthase component I [Oxalicibacterium faecigallinarum]
MFFPADSADACFALLDDCNADADTPRSRLYSRYVGKLTCTGVAQFADFLDALQQALSHGRFAVAVFNYELGAVMHGIAPHATGSALASALLFERCERLDSQAVTKWLAEAAGESQAAGIANLHADIDQAAFDEAMQRIHAYIEAGDTYQVNYTYRLRFDAFGSLAALYARLRARQPVPYGALIGMPDGAGILSLSPELFVRHDAGRLTVQPMKGTAAATGDVVQDGATAQTLAQDVKNRAENLMIVDLLRNDLGRVAEVGSVQVDRLFEVQRYQSVLQMTSTVHAALRGDATLANLFAALYPCGSITGAPKRRTMQIIRELEASPRGVYTGAIGWFDPVTSSAMASFCLSVPIRTLQLQAPVHGVRHGEMGVGAGIVHDSVAADEYAECLLKARFLTGLPTDFQLFETMQSVGANVPHLTRHLQRLQASASYFGFVFDETRIRAEVMQQCADFAEGALHRVRLALSQDGRLEIGWAPLAPLSYPVKLMLSAEVTDADDLFSRHKTTVRAHYDKAWREAEAYGAFDQLFFNAEGALTEGGRSSVFLRLRGKWVTPPLRDGLLPGVMRAIVLEDPAWQATEQTLTREDLLQAEEIMVCNALRGVMPAILQKDG